MLIKRYSILIEKTHHLSDLYELVQYAGSIIPRLYLMITVGSVYMRVSKEINTVETMTSDIPPIKEIMKDMLEMSRGVQHPTRGLFLRYYLSTMTRDYLPDTKFENIHGTIEDSVYFILQNFIEMNKLWVRLQFQGLSRDREKREQERKELRLLVGSNLVRLSQLEEMTLGMFQTNILPSILDEIVSCRDVIAQEYLTEVIIQVFQDEYHLRCLDIYLSAVARLQRLVNVKQIVISLIDRFSAYANRIREENGVEGSNGIPEEVKLFEVFWTQITELTKARPEFNLEDVMALLVSLNGLALNCYPERLEYIDKVLGLAKASIVSAQLENHNILFEGNTISLINQLLLAPISAHCKDLLIFLSLPSGSSNTMECEAKSQCLGGNYTDLLFLQPFGTRREIADRFVETALHAAIDHGFKISTVEGVSFFLGEVASIMVRDQIDGGLFGTSVSKEKQENELLLDWEDAYEEQFNMAKFVHIIKGESFETSYNLFTSAYAHFIQGGDIRIRFTLPPVVMSLLELVPSSLASPEKSSLFKTIHEAIGLLCRAREYFAEDDDYAPLFKEDVKYNVSSTKLVRGLKSPPDMALNLYLLAARYADKAGEEEMCYEFFVQVLELT